MPAQAKVGDLGSGHDACGSTALIAGSGNCFVNNKSACRATDPLGSHGCPVHKPHGRMVSQGSSSVFINNLPAARIGDPVSCGGLIVQGSGNSFFG